MPPKKKIKLVKGQQQLRISTSNLELLGNSDHSNGHESHDTEYPKSSLSLSTSATTNSSAEVRQSPPAIGVAPQLLGDRLARVSGAEFIRGFCWNPMGFTVNIVVIVIEKLEAALECLWLSHILAIDLTNFLAMVHAQLTFKTNWLIRSGRHALLQARL